jgi:hypothetical protein
MNSRTEIVPVPVLQLGFCWNFGRQNEKYKVKWIKSRKRDYLTVLLDNNFQSWKHKESFFAVDQKILKQTFLLEFVPGIHLEWFHFCDRWSVRLARELRSEINRSFKNRYSKQQLRLHLGDAYIIKRDKMHQKLVDNNDNKIVYKTYEIFFFH